MEHDGAWQDDKAIYRSHIDAIARAFEDAGVPWPRRRIAIDLRDRSLRRLNEELGSQLTSRQRALVERYRAIMDELVRECDN